MVFGGTSGGNKMGELLKLLLAGFGLFLFIIGQVGFFGFMTYLPLSIFFLIECFGIGFIFVAIMLFLNITQ
jgi:hypothetical protein